MSYFCGMWSSMLQKFVDLGVIAGFFAIWFGFLFWFISVAIRLIPDFFLSLSMPQEEKWKRLNAALLQSKNSRLSNLGQSLVAIGITIFMFVGFAWFGLHIKN